MVKRVCTYKYKRLKKELSLFLILFHLLNHRTICIYEIFDFGSLMMLIFFSENYSFESSSYDSSGTIETWFIGAVNRCSFYRYALSSCPYDSIHLRMNFIFIRPIVMSIWIIHSVKVITTIFISCWSTIISCWYNSPSFYDYWTCLTRDTLWRSS